MASKNTRVWARPAAVLMEAAATAIEAATAHAVARVILWDALLDSGTEKMCIICLDNTVDTIMQAFIYFKKIYFNILFYFYSFFVKFNSDSDSLASMFHL